DKFVKAVFDAHKTSVEDMVNIITLIDYYNFLHYLVYWIPTENETGSLVYNMLCTIYFVLDQKSVKPLQSPIKPSPYLPPLLTELLQWIIYFLCMMGQFHNTPQSLTEESLKTFYMSDKYNMKIYEPLQDGWRCFNDFFTRKLLPEARPIDCSSDPRVIVSVTNSVFDGYWDINAHSIVTLKHILWTICELLADTNYHRQHAPVDGKVLKSKVLSGQNYLEVIVKTDFRNKLILTPGQRIIKTDQPKAEIDALDSPGYQFCQARGLIVIESTKVRLVAALPIGIA
ncbi:20465_t:CDS:2, partial [Dentiscutata erythropus]